MEIPNSQPSAKATRDQHGLLIAALVSAAVVVVSVVIGTLLGDLPEALWLLLVPVGILGGAIACATCVGLALIRRVHM